MIIQPKIRGFICTTAHPVGCEKNVRDQIEKAKLVHSGITQSTLVLGASTGYGLASMITAAFSCHAKTIGVSFDRPANPDKKRTATAGWYNMAAFAREAERAGLEHHSVIGDAFSDECKQKVIECIRNTVGKVDTVIYSLAAPNRIDPVTGTRYQSVLKPIGKPYQTKSLNLNNWSVENVELEAASEEEIQSTIKVMGGEDWRRWIEMLMQADVLEENFLTIAYDYVGPAITFPIYKDGSIGQAKKDLLEKAGEIQKSGRAFLSVNKAVVTQASAAIPAVPLYISLLFKTMKEKNVHEECIDQMIRMFQKLGSGKLNLDEAGRIRMDDWEMRDDVQQEVLANWDAVTDDNLKELADIEGFTGEFVSLFGFGRNDVDYGEDIEPMVDILHSLIL